MNSNSSSSSSSSLRSVPSRKTNRKRRARKSNNKGKANGKKVVSNAPHAQFLLDSYAPARTGLLRNRYFDALARQVMVPSTVQGRFRVQPNDTPTQVAARSFRRVLNFQRSDFPDGMRFVLTPDLFRPAYVSSPVAAVLPAAGPGPVTFISKSVVFNSATGNSSSDNGGQINCNGYSTLMEFQGMLDGAAVERWGLAIGSTAAAEIVSYTVEDHTPKKAQVTKVYFGSKTLLGNWTTDLSLDMSEGASFSGNYVLPAGSVAWVMWTSTGGTGASLGVSVSFPSVQVTGATAHSLAPAFEEQAIDLRVSTGRVTSMTILITNTSPVLAKGGTIGVARVPSTFDPFSADPSTEMAKLPANRRYQGALETGGYLWWMPSQEDECTIDNLAKLRDSYNDAEYLFGYLSGWPEGASIQVTIEWGVEFYSESQLFEKEMTPPLTEAYRLHRYVLAMMPAATCNPEHEKGFKDYLKSAVQFGADSAEWVAEHKDAIVNGLALLGELVG